MCQQLIPFYFLEAFHRRNVPQCVLLLADRHLDCFQCLVNTNNAAANILVQTFSWTCSHFSWIDTSVWNCSVVWQSDKNYVLSQCYCLHIIFMYYSHIIDMVYMY